jgi:hypothetical protein
MPLYRHVGASARATACSDNLGVDCICTIAMESPNNTLIISSLVVCLRLNVQDLLSGTFHDDFERKI